MRILKIMLPLLVLLLWGATAHAQTEEEGVVYTLNTRCIPSDAGRHQPSSGKYEENTVVRLYGNPNTGFNFIQWEDEAGNVVSATESFDYTMPAHDVTLIARFEYNPSSPAEPTVPEIKNYTTINLTASPADGGWFSTYGEYIRVTDSEYQYEVDTWAELYANSNTGFRFVNWTENGEVVSTESGLAFTVGEGERSLVANFVYDPDAPSEPEGAKYYHTLTVTANPPEAVSVLYGNGEHISGTEVAVYGTINMNYVFDNWVDDRGEIVPGDFLLHYTMPYRDATLTANFHYEFNPANPDEPGVPDIDDHGIVGKPRMTMQDDTHVLILCATPGATIHYTLDGSEPTTASEVYNGPVFVPGNIIVKAIAVKEGMEDSTVTTYQVTSYRAAMPSVTFENSKITITTATEGATIYYTTDNNDPTSSSLVYTAPFDMDQDGVVKAMATLEGLTDSDIAVYVFDKADHTLEAPTFSLDAEGRLVITASREGASVYYTIDGSEPSTSSTIYTGPITLTHNCTIKALTTHSQYYPSPVAEYEVEGFVVETPTLQYADLALTIAVATEGAEIRYTLDGTIPEESSSLYSEPLHLTEDCVVVAKGFKANFNPSDTISYNFVYIDHVAAAPVLTYDQANKSVVMECATPDAEIRFTIDGTEPTAATGSRYEGPVAVVGNATYTARAFRSDLFES